MTNIYVRICRDGSWNSFEIEELTEVELQEFFETKTQAELVRWVTTLAKFIKQQASR